MNLNKLIFMLFLSVSVVAQDIGTTNVKVLEGYKPTIAEATKLNDNANFEDTLSKDRAQLYEFIDADLELKYRTKSLSVAQVKDEKISQLFPNNVSAALGASWISRANLVHNNVNSDNFSYGLIANHFSKRYHLAKNSNNRFSLFAKKVGALSVFVSNLSHARKTSSYYNDESSIEDMLFKNRYSYTKFSFSICSNEVSDNKLKHRTVFFISDLNEFAENQIHFRSNLRRKISALPVSLDFSSDNYMRYNDLYSNIRDKDFNSLFFSPKTYFSRYGFDFDIGVDIDWNLRKSAIFFPVFKFTKELVADILLINGGLRHKKQTHSLNSLFNINPYLHSFGTDQTILSDTIILQQLKVTNMHDWFFYMRNFLGWNDVLDFSVSYAKIKNFTHFIADDYLGYNHFQVAYLDVNQLHIRAAYTREINEIASINADLDYFRWGQTVYYKPNLISNLHIPINLRDKIKIVPSISYMSERSVNADFTAVLPSQFHANLELYYLFTQQLSSYLELNNLSNSKKDVWLGYREIGFNIVFGVDFSF